MNLSYGSLLRLRFNIRNVFASNERRNRMLRVTYVAITLKYVSSILLAIKRPCSSRYLANRAHD